MKQYWITYQCEKEYEKGKYITDYVGRMIYTISDDELLSEIAIRAKIMENTVYRNVKILEILKL